MTATFPGGVKQFPVINPGDPILSSTENAQQDEIKAIETEYRRMGLQNLADPNADRVLFWDDSAGALKWLTLGTGLTITDTTVIAERTHIVTANDTWNFKPASTDLFIVGSMSLSNIVVPTGHDLLVEFDAIVVFRDVYGANIYLYNSTTLLETFVAPMRMNVASARAGFHYSHKITTDGTYNLSIRCTANGSTAVDMDFLNRSLKATVI